MDWKDKALELREQGMSNRKIAEFLEKPDGTIHSFLSRNKKKIHDEETNKLRQRIETKTEIVNGAKVVTSSMLLDIQNLDEKTAQDMMILHGYDPFAWEMISVTNKAWNGTSKIQGTYTMFSSTIKVKPIEMQLDFNWMKECFNELKPMEWDVEPIETPSKLFASVDIFDIHAGKLAWSDETGNSYDLKITTKIVKRIIDQNVNYLKGLDISQIIFTMGNDLFQSDNEQNATAHGTVQDMDTRPKKVFKQIIDVMYEAIDKLSKIAPVKMLLVAGNHDATTCYYLSEVLSKAFANNPNVEIDTSPKQRKYVLIGSVLLGYAHSNEESKKEVSGLMQKEEPIFWGKSKHREFHFGHIHTEQVEEKNGMKYRWVPSISGCDKWTYGKGYTETDRTSQTFIYDEDEGLQTIKYFR